MGKVLPSRERIMYYLDYCPETGRFTRKVSAPNGPAKAGTVVGSPVDGYIRLSIDCVYMYAHRVAWLIHFGKWPEGQIDHINGNRMDNRIANLRDVDQAANQQNRIDHKGAYKTASGKWQSWITTNKKRQFLGTFKTQEEASGAYWLAKQQQHEFAEAVRGKGFGEK